MLLPNQGKERSLRAFATAPCMSRLVHVATLTELCVYASVNTNPFLSTLPGDGNGQTLITLGEAPSIPTASQLAAGSTAQQQQEHAG